jgi:hypothetical protein
MEPLLIFGCDRALDYPAELWFALKLGVVEIAVTKRSQEMIGGARAWHKTPRASSGRKLLAPRPTKISGLRPTNPTTICFSASKSNAEEEI